MEEIEWWLFEGRLIKAGHKCAARWAKLAAGSSKSHRENSISFFGIP